MWALYLLVTWVNPGGVAEVDGHIMTVEMTATHIQLDGFTTLAACNAYVLNFPIQLNGSPMAYKVAGRSCRQYTP